MKQSIPIIFSLIAAFFGSISQVLYKRAALKLSSVPLYKNFELLGGLIGFILVLVLLIIAFRKGGLLSVVYPVYASTYIWGALIAMYIENEKIWPLQWLGIIVIIAGVCLVGIGQRSLS